MRYDILAAMNSASILPTEENVRRACKQFDDDPIVEEALKDLFTQYPRNDDHPHVLLKVVALNRLYSAGIYAVYDAARHIHEHAQVIDSGLAAGSPEVVDLITAVPIKATGKVLHFWCFATKYCSWHNPRSYPIWDAHVREYLTWLRQRPEGRFLVKAPDSWTKYAEFVDMINNLRKLDTLSGCEFSFKQIDKFLYTEGGKLIAEKKRLCAAKKHTAASTQL